VLPSDGKHLEMPCSDPHAASYNLEGHELQHGVQGYPSRVSNYGRKIYEVDAAVVGTQENQDKYALARASGYSLVPIEGNRNPIYYNPSMVSYIDGSSGTMRIPRDNYAQRYISWAQFRFGNISFWHFNTHLPHNHNEAHSRNTHARIAKMLLQKRTELGADNAPTVVTGDMNPFASNGNTEGSFEVFLLQPVFICHMWDKEAREDIKGSTRFSLHRIGGPLMGRIMAREVVTTLQSPST